MDETPPTAAAARPKPRIPVKPNIAGTPPASPQANSVNSAKPPAPVAKPAILPKPVLAAAATMPDAPPAHHVPEASAETPVPVPKPRRDSVARSANPSGATTFALSTTTTAFASAESATVPAPVPRPRRDSSLANLSSSTSASPASVPKQEGHVAVETPVPISTPAQTSSTIGPTVPPKTAASASSKPKPPVPSRPSASTLTTTTVSPLHQPTTATATASPPLQRREEEQQQHRPTATSTTASPQPQRKQHEQQPTTGSETTEPAPSHKSEQKTARPVRAIAVWTSSESTIAGELCFERGDILLIKDREHEEWWQADINGKIGWVPASYLKIMDEEQGSDAAPEEVISPAVTADAPTSVDTPALSMLTSTLKASSISAAAVSTMPEAAPATSGSLQYARALFASQVESSGELAFNQGDIIEITDSLSYPDWWQGRLNGVSGWVPVNFVQMLDSNKSSEQTERLSVPLTIATTEDEPRKPSKAELRLRVISEIVSTERDYVRNLFDIIKGYIRPAEQVLKVQQMGLTRADLGTLFSNMEEIHTFHEQFEKRMTQAIEMTPATLPQVFLEAKEGFKIYSVYCGNHPKAVAYLSELQKNNVQFKAFLEGCQLLISQSLPLEGYLLTPIQRLCKYPLLLRELQKHTDETHADFKAIEDALVQMKEAASFVNEMQRQKENQRMIAELQSSIEGWEGPDLVENNVELLMETTMVKISKGKAQERRIFLFDKTIVYAKENPLKRKSYSFKGSIPLSKCNVLLSEEKGHHFAWEVTRYDLSAPKTYVLEASSIEERDKWIRAIENCQSKLDFVFRPGVRPELSPSPIETKPSRPTGAVPLKPRNLPAGAVALPMMGGSSLSSLHVGSDRDSIASIERPSSIAINPKSSLRGNGTKSRASSVDLFSNSPPDGDSAVQKGSNGGLFKGRPKRSDSDVGMGKRDAVGNETNGSHAAPPLGSIGAIGSVPNLNNNLLAAIQKKQHAAAAAANGKPIS